MLRKKFAWIILIIGLMFNNIGFAVIIGESFESPLFEKDNLYKGHGEDPIDVILRDEEIPRRQAIQTDCLQIIGYTLYFMGLMIILIGLSIGENKIKN